MSDLEPSYGVEVPRPPRWTPERRARWLFVLESLAGGLTDDGMMRWLQWRGTFEHAVADAENLRDGQIAT